jgi:hypothetical protein
VPAGGIDDRADPAGRLERRTEPGCTDENEAGDFEAVTAAGAAADLGTFRAHCARTRQIMAAHQLDDTFGKTNSYTLRWFYLYLIKEYARHLGHADLLRERIDGVTGE